MTNLNHPLEQTMKTNLNILPWLAGAVLACVVLAAPAARAQTVSTALPTTTGSVGVAKVAIKLTTSTGLVATPILAAGPELVLLSGPVSVTASYIPDPAGGPATMAYAIDATKVAGAGASGTAYSAVTAQANITRPFALVDSVQVTLPFFPKTATGYLTPRTMLLTLNVTADAVTHAVTSVTSTIGNFVAPL
jgi:hypothetical protein